MLERKKWMVMSVFRILVGVELIYFIFIASNVIFPCLYRNLKLKAHIQDCAVSKIVDFLSWLQTKS